MREQSSFSKKNIKNATTDTRGVLEELNVPPQIISFLRQNAKNLKIGAVCLVLVILGWTSLDYYWEVQRTEAAGLLAKALEEKSDDQRSQLLQNILEEYPRTDAGLWSRLELAHIAAQSGKYEDAIAQYEAGLDKLSSRSPLYPLTLYSLAQAYESSPDLDKALSRYQELSSITGFSDIAHLAMARVYEVRNEPIKASEAYAKLNTEALSPSYRQFVEAKAAKLQPVTSRSEENQQDVSVDE